jgi:tRNA A-37 threonylcarbamoyl transferase component Bud32
MLGVSLWLVWLRRENHSHRAFALFLTSFGLAVFCNTMASFAAPGAKQDWFQYTKYFEFYEIPALVYFLSFYPRPRGPFAERPWALWALLGGGLAINVWMAYDPSIWHLSADQRTGFDVGEWGPVGVLAKDNVWMALVAVSLARSYATLPAGPRRASLLLVWLGIAVNAVYDSATGSYWLANKLVTGIPLSTFFWDQLVHWLNIAALLYGGLAVVVMFDSLRRTRGSASHRRMISYALPLPVLAASLEILVARDVELFDSPFKLVVNGLVRISLALFPAYALARYRILDLDLNIKAGLRRVLVVGVFVLAAVVGVVGFRLLFEAGPPAAVGALAALALLPFLQPLRRGAGAVTDLLLPDVVPAPSYLDQRKLDNYRAAIEEALLEKPRFDDAFVRDLRRGLGITRAEHGAVLAQAREGSDVLPSLVRIPPRFVAERELGRGTSGTVVLARDTLLDRDVVLKRPLGAAAMDPTVRTNWLREAQMAARVQHPNVVTLLEVLADETPPAIVLQYVPGGSLRERLKEGPLNPQRVASIAKDALQGLVAIHESGLVHRDLKPANILLDTDGAARITDFGISRPAPVPPAGATNQDYLEATLSLAAHGVGTPMYMSPEQLDGRPVDQRSDVYSMGAILYEMLTGQPHLRLGGLSMQELRDRVRSQEEDWGLVPEAWRSVVKRALAKSPADRFQDAAGLRDAVLRASEAAEGGYDGLRRSPA